MHRPRYVTRDGMRMLVGGRLWRWWLRYLGPRRWGISDTAGGFLPHGTAYTLGRRDQGRDIQTGVGQSIIAPGRGVVVRVASDPGGGGEHFGPTYPIVRMLSGPYKGREVYVGHTVAALKQGQTFRSGEVLSRTQATGPSNGGAPPGWAEIGYAQNAVPGPFGQPTPF